MSIIKANAWQGTDGSLRTTVIQTITTVMDPSSSWTATGANSIAAVTGLTTSITPKFANSKILITLHTDFQHYTAIGDGHILLGRNIANAGWINPLSGAAPSAANNSYMWLYRYSGTWGANPVVNGNCHYIDTPNTTATIQYQPYVTNINVTTSPGYVTMGRHSRSYFIIQEIAQ